MMNFESVGAKHNAPPSPALLTYESLYKEMWGKEPVSFLPQLQECAKQLLAEDPEFEKYLSRSLVNFVKNWDVTNQNELAGCLREALSTRGLEHGLQVD